MGGESWAAVRALFEAALALAPAERVGYVGRMAADPAVRDEVLSLLAHVDDETGGPTAGWLDRPALALPPADTPSAAGRRFGAWSAERLLGRGGMGEVWEARRADGAYEGRAALKLLRPGLDSGPLLQRFEQERRALARLDHPNIARLFDAGLADDGRPFVVMELVCGEPIDRAAARRPLRERLELFLQLADAVAHAHRQLLVHRDLKPGNVLVDAEGRVKLLDFGIAKALEPTAADAELTQLGQRPFTPWYASPEQIRGEPVATATDIYSLGVLLYELLSGQRPYRGELRTAQQVAAAVLEQVPPAPSSLPPAAGPEATVPRRRLRGDLDNIVLKALAKRPQDRYPSVDALSADLRAWLEGRPVSARPPSPWHRARLFVARNRLAAAAAAAGLAGICAALVLALWQAQRADAARRAAQQQAVQTRELARSLVFKYHDQIENLPGATQAREALLTDAAAFMDSLAQASPDDLKLAEELAGTYYRISRLQGVDQSVNSGQHAQAERNLDKALAQTRRYVDRPEVSMPALTGAVNMRVSRAELWQRHGRMAEADAALVEALPLLQRALARDERDTWALASAISLHGVHARILGNQMAYAHLGRWKEACASADRSRAAAEATLAADPANKFAPDSLAFTLGEQAHCRHLGGRFDDAAALLDEQIVLRDRMSARMPDDMDFRYKRSIARAQLARVRSAQGRHAEALALLDSARGLAQQAAAADAGNVAGRGRLDALAVLQSELQLVAGQTAAARASAERALQQVAEPAATAQYAERRLRVEVLLGAARAWHASDPARALAWADQAASLLAPPRDGDDNVARRWLLAEALGERAAALAAAGRQDEAVRAAAQALTLWQQAGPDGVPPLLQPRVERAQRLARTGG